MTGQGRGKLGVAKVSTALAWLTVAGCAGTQPHDPSPTQRASTAPRVETTEERRYGETRAAREFLAAVDARLAVMQEVAAAKWLAGSPIADSSRESAVLDAVARDATALGLDAAGARELLAVQVRIAREWQLREQDRWRESGQCEPCSAAPTLEVARPRIDAATRDQLRALAVLAPTLDRAEVARAIDEGLAQIAATYALKQAETEALANALHSSTRRPGTLARIRASGVLRIGTTGDYAPFSLEGADGTLSGADVDLAVSLAQALGVEPVFVRTSWPTLAKDLARNRYDVALSGISPTPERAGVGAFSSSYHAGGKTVIARCADRARLGSLAAVDRPSVRVIVNPSGTNERYVREHVHAAQVIVHGDNRTVFDELVAGHADAMITDDVEADLQALRHPELCRTMPGTLTRGEKQIFMATDPDLQATVESWLASALADGIPARYLQQATQKFVSQAGRP